MGVFDFFRKRRGAARLAEVGVPLDEVRGRLAELDRVLSRHGMAIAAQNPESVGVEVVRGERVATHVVVDVVLLRR